MKSKTTLTGNLDLKAFLAGILLCFIPLVTSAQDMQDTIIAHFSFFEQVPQEKLYLHLDKPFYGAGEKIWFKGYLVNAVTNVDNTQSNFIITELVNRSDSIVERRKIRRDSLGFHNAFTLPPTLPAGDYYLRGYSNWMLNQEPEFFYSRQLKIGNSIDNTIVSTIEYLQEDDNNYTAIINFTKDTREAFQKMVVRYQYMENGKVKHKDKKKTDDNGRIFISLPDLKHTAKRLITVDFEDPTYTYKKTFYLPSFNRDFDIQFFPEGGALLNINHQNIAFKALGSDGLSKEIEGFLFNEKGDTLVSIRSEHDGMGIFMINRSGGNSYYVIASTPDGISKRFDLPAVEQKGIGLSLTHYKREIRYAVQKTESTEWPQKLFLLAHTRGKLSILQPVNTQRPVGKLNDSIFDAGITHFMLIDEQGKILSERLAFVPDRDPHRWQIFPDKPAYGKREKVSLQISAKDSNGDPLVGSYSISITDSKSIRPDSLADNIASNLLLTSDLKGFIENPGYYFLNQDPGTLRALDFLMLTHGWRRHHIKNVLDVPTLSINHFMEKGQTISGRIKGFFGSNIKKGPISILAPKQQIFATTTTDEKGEFIADVSFKDSTAFFIQARTKRGFAGVDIEIDYPQYPAIGSKLPYRDEKTSFMDDYLLSTRDQYYMEGGMRVYNLKEVVIKASRPRPRSKSFYMGGINTYTIEADILQKMGGHTAIDIVRRLPGVTVSGSNQISVRNNPQQPLIIIDDVIYEDDSEVLTFLNSEDISNVSLLRGPETVIFGTRGSAGVIVIELKYGKELPAKPARGAITYNPLGYSDSVEFYHPAYDTPEKKQALRSDFRSTIYWNPLLQLDAEGKATVEYYTPDSSAPEDIIIEGVDKNGKICRVAHTINN